MSNDILVKIGADVTDFSRKLSESNRALSDFGKANQATFDAFKTSGKIVTAAGASIAAGLGVAVKKAADFEGGMSKVAAVSGATGKELDILTDTAREWGSKTSFSALEAAEGLEYMALAGYDTQQMVEGLGPILYLAEAGAIDLGRASDLVTDSMAGLGLEVNELDGYLDKVAATASNANTDIDALMEAFVVAGGTFDRLNVPLEEANAFLGVMANRGFKASEAGTAINAIMSRLTKETGPAADALKDMGVAVFDSEGNFRGMETVLMDVRDAMEDMTDAERENALTLIAGLNHGKSFNAMLEGLGNEYGDLKGKIENSNGALEEMRDIMKDNLQGALENLSSGFDELLISLGDALLPAVKVLVSTLQGLVDWFNGLSDGMKSFIAIGAAVAAALMLVVGPLLWFIGIIPQLIAGFTAIVTVVKFIAGVIAALAGTISLPFVLIAAAVVALAALIYFYWDEIKAFTIAAWGAIADFFVELWQTISEGVVTAWQAISEFFTELWETITEVAMTAWNAFVEAIIAIITPFVEQAMNVFEGMIDGLMSIFSGLSTYFQGVWELIKNIFLGAVLLLVNLVTGNFEELGANARAIWNNIKSALAKIWDGIKQVFSGALDAIKGGVMAAWENIKSNTNAAMNFVKSIISAIWNGIKSFFTSTLASIVSTVASKFAEMISTIAQKMSEVVSRIRSGWDNAMSFLRGINLRQIGRDIIQGLINGITSKVKAVGAAISKVTSAITGKVKSILKLASPSKLMIQYGRWTGEGLAKGIEYTRGIVDKASEKLAVAATPDKREIDLSYATPSGLRSSLVGAVSGTVDVNSREDMLVSAVGRLERKLTDLTVEMDGRTVGRIVEPHVSRAGEARKINTNRARGI